MATSVRSAPKKVRFLFLLLLWAASACGQRVTLTAEQARRAEADGCSNRQNNDRTIPTIPAAGPLSRGMEAHDCQQIYINRWGPGGVRYGSLITLWLKHQEQRLAEADYQRPRYVVYINKTGNDEIDNLKLEEPFNCLILQNNGTAWRAWVAPLESETATCRDDMPVDPDDALRVWRVKQPPLADETSKYPLAVRFHEVGESKEYYIGFQCGEQHWCVIGVDDAAKPPKGLQPVTSGFVDEQRLGIYDADDRELKPTDLRGLLVARQDIASLDTAAFVDKIVRVADLYIQGDDDEAREFYAVKYGLDDVSETHGPIVVSLSYRRGGFKFYYNGKATDRPTEIKPKDSDHPLPGGARWRWSTNDEGVWIFCPAGCCGDDGCVPPYCDRR